MDSHSSLSDNVPLREGVLDVECLIDNLSVMLEQPDLSNARIKEYIENIKLKKIEHKLMSDQNIKDIILKHPYFKNPCKYPIRLINIMKHLKKKGLDVSEKDIDIRVDRILSGIDGIERIEFGRYINANRSLK